MNNDDVLARAFDAQRIHLNAVAYRILGSRSEAEDAVQEAWFRLGRQGEAVDNLRAWLTTVVSRICLDSLRARRARAEDTLDEDDSVDLHDHDRGADPEHQAMLADAIGPAMLVVLDTLAPSERLAYVLHDMFGVAFEDIAVIVGRSTDAARQLASRGRRRVQGLGTGRAGTSEVRRSIVEAFLKASRDGDFAALLSLLDPDVVLRADAAAVAASLAAVAYGAPKVASEVRGASNVAEVFNGRARAARVALVDNAYGAAYAPGGNIFTVFDFVIESGRITGINVVVDKDILATMDVRLL
jgi:RNA polymerase sigma-70 factor, ECF subfamily